MPFESHKLMKKVPVIRCQFCPYERAGGPDATADVERHEQTTHAKQLFEKQWAERASRPAPPPSTAAAAAAAAPTRSESPAAAPAVEPSREVPDGPSGFELPPATPLSDTAPEKLDKGEKKSTKPGGAGTKATTT